MRIHSLKFSDAIDVVVYCELIGVPTCKLLTFKIDSNGATWATRLCPFFSVEHISIDVLTG